MLDEVALYNTVLGKSTLEAHLQALYLPAATGRLDWRAGLINPSFEDPVLPDSGSGVAACNYDPGLPTGWAGSGASPFRPSDRGVVNRKQRGEPPEM